MPQVLRIHASSENDPYFLHTLEVTEDDFQCLKADQGILVDFASFPGKIISLLERCIGSHAADTPRFQAVLSCRPADSTLKIVETNDFKQLAHITLAFKPGDDFTVKQVCWLLYTAGSHVLALLFAQALISVKLLPVVEAAYIILLKAAYHAQHKLPCWLPCSSWHSGWVR